MSLNHCGILIFSHDDWNHSQHYIHRILYKWCTPDWVSMVSSRPMTFQVYVQWPAWPVTNNDRISFLLLLLNGIGVSVRPNFAFKSMLAPAEHMAMVESPTQTCGCRCTGATIVSSTGLCCPFPLDVLPATMIWIQVLPVLTPECKYTQIDID